MAETRVESNGTPAIPRSGLAARSRFTRHFLAVDTTAGYLGVLFGRTARPWWWRLEAASVVLPVIAGISFGLWGAWAIVSVRSKPASSQPVPAHEDDAVPTKVDPSHLAALRGSTLFRTSTGEAGSTASAPNATLAELCQNLQLRGLLGGDVPRAIILYRPTQQTVWVSVGEYVGQVQLVEIRATSVVLGWNNEKVEINL